MERKKQEHRCKECGEAFNHGVGLRRHQKQTGHKGSDIAEGTPSKPEAPVSEVPSQPLTPLQLESSEVRRQLKEISENFEWKRMISGVPEETDLRLTVRDGERRVVSKLFKKLEREFALETGVLLPKVGLDEGPTRVLTWKKDTKLGTLVSTESLRQDLSKLLKENAWRFLSVRQVEEQLKELWVRQPELQRAYREADVKLLTTVTVLEEVLKTGASIRDFPFLIECIAKKRLTCPLSDVADAVIAAMNQILRSSNPTGRSSPKPPPVDSLVNRTLADDITLEVGRGLLCFVDPREGATFLERVSSIRASLVQESGWVAPGVRFRDNLALQPNEFRILLRDAEHFLGEVYVNLFLVIGPQDRLAKVRGIDGVEPTFGMAGKWVEGKLREQCEKLGCMIFTPESVMAVALTETLWAHASMLFNHQTFRAYLDTLKTDRPAIVKMMDESPSLVKSGKIVVCRLLEERVSIRDQLTILETLVDHEADDLSPYFVTELIREKLGTLICQSYQRENGELYALTLSKEFEELCLSSLRKNARKAWLEPTAKNEKIIRQGLRSAVEQIQEEGHRDILVTRAELRRPLLDFVKRDIPGLTVLSELEVPTRMQLVSIGEVSSLARELKNRQIRHYPRVRGARKRFRKFNLR
jgi:flagellar biosynthesis component FlhA